MLNQLTRLTTTGTGGIDIQYSYSTNQNNGKILQTQDYITGEQVTYTYDVLLRLASAATSANPSVPQWGQSYAYDGFGNLTDQTLTQGTGPGRSCNRKRREQSANKRRSHLRYQRE